MTAAAAAARPRTQRPAAALPGAPRGNKVGALDLEGCFDIHVSFRGDAYFRRMLVTVCAQLRQVLRANRTEHACRKMRGSAQAARAARSFAASRAARCKSASAARPPAAEGAAYVHG